MVPSVVQSVIDGQVGDLSGISGRIQAIVGCSVAGPVATPVVLAKEADVRAAFGSAGVDGPQGKLVELACNAIRRAKRPVMCLRAATVTGGTCGAITRRMTGAAVPTISTAAASPGTAVAHDPPVTDPATFTAGGTPIADASVQVKFTATVTVGTDPVPYQYSINGGVTWSPVLVLPVGTYTISLAEIGWSLAITHGAGANKIAVNEYVTATAAAASPNPADDFLVVFAVTRILTPAGASVSSGTVGTDTVFGKWSLDNGLTWLTEVVYAPPAPGAQLWQIPDNYGSVLSPSDAGKIVVSVTAATVYVGDSFGFSVKGPRWSSGTLATALTALGATALDWEQVQLAEPVDDTESGAAAAASVISQLSAFIADQASAALGAASYRWFSCSLRPPLLDLLESDDEYQAYAADVRALCSSTFGFVGAGACQMVSAISGRQYHRTAGDPVGAVIQGLSEEQSCANLNNVPGGLPGVTILDVYGNADDHDEAAMPGLDDLNFLTLRTWRGRTGTYVNQDKIFCPAGSSFTLVPIRRVFNLFQAAIDSELIPRIMSNPQVNPKTGYLAESEAAAIDSAVLSAIDAVVMKKPKASGRSFALSRNDDVLRTRTFTGTAKLVTLAYPARFEIEVAITRTV